MTDGSPCAFAGCSGSLDGCYCDTCGRAPLAAAFVAGPSPVAVEVSVGAAANANGGALDAELVRVIGVTVTAVGDTIQVGDGSATVGVVIDPSTGIGTGQFTIGRTFNLTGVLVPAAGGAQWILKPRSPADVVPR